MVERPNLEKKSPPPGKSRFTEFIVRENGLDRKNFRWAFWPGMLFLAMEKWWGDRGERTVPHEGVDFCLHEDRQGKLRRLEEGARVPVMYDGVVVRIIDDFLGKSVIVAHHFTEDMNDPFITIYGHTVPLPDLEMGAAIGAGEIIATIAHGRSGVGVHPHLHLSVGRATGLVSYKGLEWGNMTEAVAMSNPLDLIEDGYHVLPQVGP
jgi:hypothetical protein